MKGLFFYVFVFIVIFVSKSGFAGELIYSIGYIKPGCQVVYNRIGQCGVYQTLTCNGAIVMEHSSMPACFAPAPFIDRKDLIHYDFDSSSIGADYVLGIVSVKSSANVFSARPLSKNYRSYSNDGILDKPIILVEGYDPENNTNPDYYYDHGFNQLVYGGRDLIIVNLPNGAASTNENAALLQKIIQEINGAKLGGYPTAVIGYSMGGIVARKALKNMELAGINHQVSLYVSYDSPQLGANSPMSLQETVQAMINKLDRDLFGYTPSGLKRARYIYDSPAASEMLIAGANYQAAIPASFPLNLARIGVTSGSMAGALQDYSVVLGEQVAQFKIYFKKNDYLQSHIDASFSSKLRGGQYYDNVPGSYEFQYDEAFAKIQEGAATVSISQNPAIPYSRRITFVPTTSALAIAGAVTTPARDTFRSKSPFDKYIAVDQSDWPSCGIYRSQTSLGENSRHNPHYAGEVFNQGQLSQLKCALDEFHKIGAAIPDRSFKTY